MYQDGSGGNRIIILSEATTAADGSADTMHPSMALALGSSITSMPSPLSLSALRHTLRPYSLHLSAMASGGVGGGGGGGGVGDVVAVEVVSVLGWCVLLQAALKAYSPDGTQRVHSYASYSLSKKEEQGSQARTRTAHLIRVCPITKDDRGRV
jgi:hypothetical protein